MRSGPLVHIRYIVGGLKNIRHCLLSHFPTCIIVRFCPALAVFVRLPLVDLSFLVRVLSAGEFAFGSPENHLQFVLLRYEYQLSSWTPFFVASKFLACCALICDQSQSPLAPWPHMSSDSTCFES